MKLHAPGLGALAFFIAEDSADVFIAVDAALTSEALEITLFKCFAFRYAYTIPSTRQIGLAQRTNFLTIPHAGFPHIHGAVVGTGRSVLAARERRQKQAEGDDTGVSHGRMIGRRGTARRP